MAVVFSDVFTGANGAAWDSAKWTVSPNLAIQDIQANEGRARLNDGGAFSTSARARAIATMTAQADQEILLSFRWADITTTTGRTYFRTFVRADGAWFNSLYPNNAYFVEVQSDSQVIRIGDVVAGTYTNRVTPSTAAPAPTTVKQWLRIRVEGFAISARVWVDGTAEPTTWGATWTDTTSARASGVIQPHVRYSSGATIINTCYLDDLSVDNLQAGIPEASSPVVERIDTRGVRIRATVTADTTSARLMVTTDHEYKLNPLYSPSLTPSAGSVTGVVAGLLPDTRYYYAWELNGSLAAGGRGTFVTPRRNPISAGVVLIKSAARLTWRPPKLTSPVTINVPVQGSLTNVSTAEPGNGVNRYDLTAGQDYIIKLPAEKRIGGVHLYGGRHIVIIGGYISPNPNKTRVNSDLLPLAIYCKNQTGTIHIEGVLFDDSTGGQGDSVNVEAPNATLQMQNIRGILTGYDLEVHSDFYGGYFDTGEIRMDRCTCITNYHGVYLNGRGPAHIKRTNCRYQTSSNLAVAATGDTPGDDPAWKLWWITSNVYNGTTENACIVRGGLVLEECYSEPRSGKTLANSIVPTATYPSSGCGSVDASIWTPGANLANVYGSIKLGPPPGGDFCPEGVAGVAYKSPGYVN